MTLRHAVIASIVLAAVGIAGPVAWQPAAAQATAQPSPNAVLLAKQIVEIKGIKGLLEPVVRGVIEKAKAVFLQTNFMWEKDINEVTLDMHKQYDSRVNELVDATARIYASHFTEAELKNILAFYQSPLGQKMIAEEPNALNESMLNAGKMADTLSDEVMASMRAEMKKRGHDM